MREHDVLFRVELPLSLPLIFAGIRTAAVYVVSTATIAAIAGGGGLGDIIVNQASYRFEGVSRRRVLRRRAGAPGGLRARWGAAGAEPAGAPPPARVRARRDHRPGPRPLAARGVHSRHQGPDGAREGRRSDSQAHPARREGRLLHLVRRRHRVRRIRRRRGFRAGRAADDQARHQELHRGVHPRTALQAGARGQGLQGRLPREHRLDGDHRQGAHERPDQRLSGVPRDAPLGHLPQDLRAEEPGDGALAGAGALRQARVHALHPDAVLRHRRSWASSTRRPRSTTSSRSGTSRRSRTSRSADSPSSRRATRGSSA